MLTITPIYLAIAVVLYSFMAFVIISNRWRRKISIGDGRQQDFARIIRGHANFSEYAPITLLAMGCAELAGAPAQLLHVCGTLLLAGRSLHAYCFLYTPVGTKLRVSGMMMTFFALWVATGGAIYAVLN
ncbi:MAG: MAPEG family protein [Rhodospirillales bacterium]|nr:MAPEG family protein [Rhodospirillales bacterium]MBO6786989.1 MAPEG family protein [Rhodospirillales bacterium]